MDDNSLPVAKCAKCHGPLPETRTRRRLYCTDECKDTAMKRRRRGQPTADALPAAAAAELSARVVGLEATLHRTSSALVRAQESRDKQNARARKLETAVAAARRHSDSVIGEQAAKTAGLREEAAMLRRQLSEALAALKERQTASPAAANDAAVTPAEVARLRQRLAEGNAAYGQLTAKYDGLWNAFEQARAQAKDDARIHEDWDRLCRRLYQSTKGKPTTEADQQILTRWITRRNLQHAQSQNEQQRKKSGKK